MASGEDEQLRWAEKIALGESLTGDADGSGDAAGPDEGFQLLQSVARAFRGQDELEGTDPEAGIGLRQPSQPEPELRAGLRVGPFALASPLGEGGMGVVWKAHRVEGGFQQVVALKLLRFGAGSNPMARFRQERQILASLDHPGIARLVDGGTTAWGRPWMAMEYVEGDEVTTHCDRLSLPIEARLRLFLLIAEALDAAHRRLVVHRDLKPSNILVTTEGEPRLLDFGIAKLLTPTDDIPGLGLTLTRAQPLTPLYASPEQLRNEQITVASDVYQLGLLLHQLLTGRRAHRLSSSSWISWEREICETPPRRPSLEVLASDTTLEESPEGRASRRGERPSSLARRLRGDLDTIIAKALSLEPERRYRSVSALAEDIERHLKGLPVLARPATAGYRLSKLVRRHPGLVAATTVATVAMIGLTVLYTVLLVRQRDAAETARALAEERRISAEAARDESEQVSDFLAALFEAANPHNNLGEEPTARKLLELGIERLESGAIDRPRVRARLLETVGWVQYRLGRYDPATRLIEAAVALDRAGAGAPLEDELRRLERLGVCYWRNSSQGDAEEAWLEAQERHQAAWGLEDPRAESLLFRLGNLHLARNEFGAAVDRLRHVLALRTAREGPESITLLPVLNNLGVSLVEQGQWKEAENTYRRALAIASGAGDDRHPEVARLHLNLGNVLRRTGRPEEARDELARAAEMRVAIYKGEDHSSLAEAWIDLGRAEWDLGRSELGEELVRRGLGMRTRLHGADHRNIGQTLVDLAEGMAGDGRLVEAQAVAAEALAIFDRWGDTPAALLERTRLLLAND